MLSKLSNWFIVLAPIVIVAIVGYAVWVAAHDEGDWTLFVMQHHCREVTHYSDQYYGGVDVRVDNQGEVSVTSGAEKSAWLCDDGITYVRSN